MLDIRFLRPGSAALVERFTVAASNVPADPKGTAGSTAPRVAAHSAATAREQTLAAVRAVGGDGSEALLPQGLAALAQLQQGFVAILQGQRRENLKPHCVRS